MDERVLKSLILPIDDGQGNVDDVKYLIPQGTVTEADLEDLKENGTVANARQLIPSAMETERVPYNFRTSGGSLDIGDREFDKLVGLSLPWNQLIENGNFASTNGWGVDFASISVSNNILTMSPSESGRSNFGVKSMNAKGQVAGHKYFMAVDVKASVNCNIYPQTYNVGLTYAVTANTWTTLSRVFTINNTTENYTVRLNATLSSGTFATTDTVQAKNYVIVDLTQLLGSTIADYIYSLETATAGAGVAWFKKFFPKQYYAYNSGEIESVKVSSHDMVGFNQWDEEWEIGAFNVTTGANTQDFSDQIRSKNLIPVLPNTQYYLSFPVASGVGAWAMFYDGNGNICTDLTGVSTSSVSGNSVVLGNIPFTTPKNASYMKFYMTRNYGGTYKHDICIHLKWDGARDGEYEPYKKNSYALDPIELRGILKLDSNNEPYADGDTYEADGTVTRRYGIVDLGTLTWVYYSSENAFYCTINAMYRERGNLLCSKYKLRNLESVSNINDYEFTNGSGSSKTLWFKNSAYTDATAFKTAMSGVYLVYELATPTTESADPFTDPQTVDNWGTEQYVDKAYTDGDRDVEIPVGHETKYPVNLRDKLETAPNAPTSDGDYIVHCESGQLTYIALGSTTTIQNIIARLEALEG